MSLHKTEGLNMLYVIVYVILLGLILMFNYGCKS